MSFIKTKALNYEAFRHERLDDFDSERLVLFLDGALVLGIRGVFLEKSGFLEDEVGAKRA